MTTLPRLNTVSFYRDADGLGANLLAQVLASDLCSAFDVDNTQEPGYLLSFLVPEGYGSVVFTTGSSDFEFAVTAVPEPSTWAMLGIGFAGLALTGYKRSRDRLAPALG
jgi:PEP-CTERM motif